MGHSAAAELVSIGLRKILSKEKRESACGVPQGQDPSYDNWPTLLRLLCACFACDCVPDPAPVCARF